MKTQEVLSMLDKQKRKFNQIDSLTNTLVNVVGISTHTDNAWRDCFSILFDLPDDFRVNYKINTQSFIQIGTVDDCVNGTMKSYV